MNYKRTFIDDNEINTIPTDLGYDLKVFNSPKELTNAIKIKAEDTASGISRVIATFDWKFKEKKRPDDAEYWYVKEDNWEMPWNLQLKEDNKTQRRKNRHLSWGEQPHTINEVGSTYTVQGLDLNYAGVIIGPSVKYRDGKVVYDPSRSKNASATQNRTLEDGTKQKFGEKLIKNELNVLLTRGVNGLYLYAVDDELQKALMKAYRESL